MMIIKFRDSQHGIELVRLLKEGKIDGIAPDSVEEIVLRLTNEESVRGDIGFALDTSTSEAAVKQKIPTSLPPDTTLIYRKESGQFTLATEYLAEIVMEALGKKAVVEAFSVERSAIEVVSTASEELETSFFVIKMFLLQRPTLNNAQVLRLINNWRVRNKRKPLSKRAIRKGGFVRRLLEGLVRKGFLRAEVKKVKYGSCRTRYALADTWLVKALKALFLLDVSVLMSDKANEVVNKGEKCP